MASPNLSEIVTTTLRNRSRTLADNVSNNNALLRRLKDRGGGANRPFSGGRTIVQELEYAENATYKRYSGYEVLNISPSDVFSAAEFNIKQAATAVTISGLEQLQNSSSEQMIDLLESRIGNAERTMMNQMSIDAYSDGTADGGKQIGGLQLLVSDAPTAGVVGGIDRAVFDFWQNQLWDFSVEAVAPSATTIQQAMNTLYLRCSRGPDRPDMIVMDNIYFDFYLTSLQAIQRVTSDTDASAGFANLKFWGNNADVMFDGGIGGAAPASHGYFLNTQNIHWRPHSDRNMVPLDPDRFAVNQDALVKLIAFAGNMTASNLFLQGVMHD